MMIPMSVNPATATAAGYDTPDYSWSLSNSPYRLQSCQTFKHSCSLLVVDCGNTQGRGNGAGVVAGFKNTC